MKIPIIMMAAENIPAMTGKPGLCETGLRVNSGDDMLDNTRGVEVGRTCTTLFEDGIVVAIDVSIIVG